jgi:hypothetical protein
MTPDRSGPPHVGRSRRWLRSSEGDRHAASRRGTVRWRCPTALAAESGARRRRHPRAARVAVRERAGRGRDARARRGDAGRRGLARGAHHGVQRLEVDRGRPGAGAPDTPGGCHCRVLPVPVRERGAAGRGARRRAPCPDPRPGRRRRPGRGEGRGARAGRWTGRARGGRPHRARPRPASAAVVGPGGLRRRAVGRGDRGEGRRADRSGRGHDHGPETPGPGCRTPMGGRAAGLGR